MWQRRSEKADERSVDGNETSRSDYTVCKLLGANRISCFDAKPKRNETFTIPGKVSIY